MKWYSSKKKGKNIMPSRNIRPGFISKFPPILQAVSNWWKTEKNHYFHRKFRKGNIYLTLDPRITIFYCFEFAGNIIGMSVWYAEIFYKRQNGFNNDLYLEQYQYNIQEETKRGLRKWFYDWQ